MADSDVLTNQFVLRYDEGKGLLRIYTVHDGDETPFPIDIRLEVLEEMGSEKAAKWVGETLLLLIPEIRLRLYGIKLDQ